MFPLKCMGKMFLKLERDEKNHILPEERRVQVINVEAGWISGTQNSKGLTWSTQHEGTGACLFNSMATYRMNIVYYSGVLWAGLVPGGTPPGMLPPPWGAAPCTHCPLRPWKESLPVFKLELITFGLQKGLQKPSEGQGGHFQLPQLSEDSQGVGGCPSLLFLKKGGKRMATYLQSESYHTTSVQLTSASPSWPPRALATWTPTGTPLV